jgi:hypothetical protein
MVAFMCNRGKMSQWGDGGVCVRRGCGAEVSYGADARVCKADGEGNLMAFEAKMARVHVPW